MTRIIALSDSHHKHYYIDLPEGDILIHAGDFSFRGEHIERILILEWLKWVSKRYKDVIIVMGNHDIGMTKDWYNSVKIVHGMPENIHWLQDSSCVVQGIQFYGSPYSVRFGDWGFGEPEEKLIKRFSHIPKDTEILITHGPAKGILDINKHGEECGSIALYDKIKKLPKLKHHIFGHIHESYGHLSLADIDFWNVSILDEYYHIKNKPTIIEV